MLNLKIIIGSTRPGRNADRIIPWVTAKAREHGAFELDMLDLRERARTAGTLPPAAFRLMAMKEGAAR